MVILLLENLTGIVLLTSSHGRRKKYIQGGERGSDACLYTINYFGDAHLKIFINLKTMINSEMHLQINPETHSKMHL